MIETKKKHFLNVLRSFQRFTALLPFGGIIIVENSNKYVILYDKVIKRMSD